jgi:hypothetical protein
LGRIPSVRRLELALRVDPAPCELQCAEALSITWSSRPPGAKCLLVAFCHPPNVSSTVTSFTGSNSAACLAATAGSCTR